MKKPYLFLIIFIVLFVIFTFLRAPKKAEVIKIKKEKQFLTVIVTKNEENIYKLLKNFENYKFINELIIWNNGLKPLETIKSIKLQVKIINSPNDARDLSQFIACSRATNEACYFQSDQWNNQLIRSLWNSYKRFPKTISVISPPSMLWEHRKLSFYSRCKHFKY